MKRPLSVLLMLLLVGCTTPNPVPPAPPPTPMPGSGTTQPGTGTAQPGTGTTEPGTGTAQPGARTPPREGVGLWSPSGTYLWYDSASDAWAEIDPATNKATPFLPMALTGQKAGNLRFSPDGRRLLYDGQEPRSTFVINTDGMDRYQVGVNVDVHWEGNDAVIASQGYYPPDTKTGDAAVDRVIAALNQKDLHSLVKLSSVACTTQVNGMGNLPCPEGTPDGTILQVFPMGSCEVSFLPAGDQLRSLFDNLTAQQPALYAVYRVNPPQGSHVYGILLQHLKQPWTAVTLRIDGTGSIVMEYGCGPVVNMVPHNADFLLAPR